MKRLERNPEKYDVLELFDAIGQRKNFRLNNEESKADFLTCIGLSLDTNTTPTMLYGRRVESMFGYMVASLRKCILIKKEDCGEVFIDTDTETIKIPDYHVVTQKGDHFLIEVKNFHPNKSNANFKIGVEYVSQLNNYSTIIDVELKIAIYWSAWNLWTLVSPDDFSLEQDHYEITLPIAMKVNQMSRLGDFHIGATPNLGLRIYANWDEQVFIAAQQSISYKIKKIEFFCAGQVIKDIIEQHIAFELMLFGSWNCIEPHAHITKNKLEFIEYLSVPEDRNTGQNFQIIGSLSGIISKQYKWLTAPNGKVERFSPDINTGMLGFEIPADYKGKQLPLWRFNQEHRRNE